MHHAKRVFALGANRAIPRNFRIGVAIDTGIAWGRSVFSLLAGAFMACDRIWYADGPISRITRWTSRHRGRIDDLVKAFGGSSLRCPAKPSPAQPRQAKI
jgi:hypothetical protein